MRLILLILATVATVAMARRDREGKVFSLFNIVTFQNSACTSTAAGTSANRQGTCLTSNECSSRSGSANGACAAGFGVCCVFFLESGTVSQNCTYLRNAGFPSAFTGTGNVAYTVNKCSCNVCALRLDFETFNTLGPADTVETTGGLCRDTFVAASPTVTNFATICGLNTGEHIYVDFGGNCADAITLTFSTSSTAFNSRMWDMKATQVECTSRTIPPSGCLQYLTATSGQIKSFNFDNTAQTHLQNQRQQVCIRQAAGFCCVQYTVCTDTGSNTLLTNTISVSLADASCPTDYLMISGATNSCAGSSNNVDTVSKICGNVFSIFINSKNTQANIAICDCSQPFDLSIITDATAETASATIQSRGLCLNYMQLPCSTA